MQKPIEFTQAQKSILEIDKEQNFLVSASAGAGKTTIMVERIKKLIENKHVEIDKMLVVTFTKLAALEMKQKLFDKLADATDPFVVEQREQIDTCHIGTIHSFCADVVREYFYLVDVDPNFSVLADNEAEVLFDKAIEKVFDNRYRNDQEFVFAMEKFCVNRDDELLRKNVKKIYEFMEGIDDVDAWYDKTTKEFDDERIKQYFNDKVIAKNAYLKNKIYDLSLVFATYDATKIVERLEKIRVSLCAKDKNDLNTNLEWLSQTKIPSRSEKDETQDNFNCPDENRLAVLSEYVKLVDAVKEFIKYAKELNQALTPNAYAQQQQEESFCRFCLQLSQEVRQVYANIKKEKNVVDFSDMEKMTLEILKDQKASEQIKNDIDYVFVDEFQDVNGIQEKLLSMVAKPNRLFVVGDVKQSIYAFRQADPDIFVHKQEDYLLDKTNNNVVFMNDNFRSDKQVGDFVNYVFCNTMTQEFGMVDYQNSGKLEAKGDVKIEGEDYCVNVVRIDPTILATPTALKGIYDPTQEENKEDISLDKAEGRFIANTIKQLVGRKKLKDGKEIELKQDQDQKEKYVSYKDIVILCRGLKNGTIETYKQLLKDGIPVVINYEGQTNYKEIDDLIAFFKVINNHYDDYTLATLLVSPLCNATYDELVVLSKHDQSEYLWQKVVNYSSSKEDFLSKKLKDLLNLLNKYETLSKVLKSGELMLKLIQERDYEKYVTALPNGLIRRERLFSFIQQVGATTILEILQTPLNLDGLSCGETAEDVVRIMTMHASKGLEFDVVFLAGLHRGFNNKIKGNVRINKRCGMSVWLGEKERTIPTLKGLLVKEYDEWKQKEEELRLFYVALTRAKRKLICSFVSSSNKKVLLVEPYEAGRTCDWLQNIDYDSNECAYECLSAYELIKEENQPLDTSVDLTKQEQQETKIKREYSQAMTWQYPYREWLDLPLKVVSSKLDMELFTKKDLTEELFAKEQEVVQIDLTAPREGEDKTQIGKAYHKILERCDFDNDSGLNKTLDLLVDEGWFDIDTANQVDLSKIKQVLNNPEFKKLYEGDKIYRETPILTTLPYDQLFGEGSSREIMLQGVIDLLVIKDDQAIVVDFKVTTNSFKIKERYQKQLNSYGMAVNKCLKLPVKTYVVSILDNKIIEF
ncbi:MAG: UvrD-helicase domain-containing protein [Clostridia bacterium]|nr:UvrD-helicase domain-containing protein [Clostridia bacterium]